LHIILGKFLERKLTEAMEESQVHSDLFRIIERAVDAANPALLKDWADGPASWERNPHGDVDCPYVPQHRCMVQLIPDFLTYVLTFFAI
jgi:hypothetical protein